MSALSLSVELWLPSLIPCWLSFRVWFRVLSTLPHGVGTLGSGGISQILQTWVAIWSLAAGAVACGLTFLMHGSRSCMLTLLEHGSRLTQQRLPADPAGAAQWSMAAGTVGPNCSMAAGAVGPHWSMVAGAVRPHWSMAAGALGCKVPEEVQLKPHQWDSSGKLWQILHCTLCFALVSCDDNLKAYSAFLYETQGRYFSFHFQFQSRLTDQQRLS